MKAKPKEISKKELQSIEDRKLRFLDLSEDISIGIKNEKSREINWYGRRLWLLRNFYNKSLFELAFYLNNNRSTVSMWELSKEKPNLNIIMELEFIFEVNEGFFTDEIVDLRFIEQTKINQL